jgi:hypothetical protein
MAQGFSPRRVALALLALVALVQTPCLHAVALPDTGAIEVWAETTETPPAITLKFLYGKAYTIHRRVYGQKGSWGAALVTTSASATSWVDNNVAVGTTYEYAIKAGSEYGFLHQSKNRGTRYLPSAA